MGKPGSKYHILVDAAGVPLAALLSRRTPHDSRLLDAAPAVKPPDRGRPRRRPTKLHANKAYDFPVDDVG